MNNALSARDCAYCLSKKSVMLTWWQLPESAGLSLVWVCFSCNWFSIATQEEKRAFIVAGRDEPRFSSISDLVKWVINQESDHA